MEIFQFSQMIFATLGISSNRSMQRFNSFKTFVALLMYGLGFIFTVLFLSREATTFNEFTEAIYVCSADCIIGIAFVCMKIKTKTLFEFLGTFENFFQISEWHQILESKSF